MPASKWFPRKNRAVLVFFCASSMLGSKDSMNAQTMTPASRDGLVAPKILHRPGPPLEPCKHLEPTTLRISYVVSKDGSIKKLKIPKLPVKVQSCVRTLIGGFQYSPGRKDGQPISVKVHLTINLGRESQMIEDQE